jgi:hypothetical protein
MDFLIFIFMAFFAMFIQKTKEFGPDTEEDGTYGRMVTRNGKDEDQLTIPDDVSDRRSRVSRQHFVGNNNEGPVERQTTGLRMRPSGPQEVIQEEQKEYDSMSESNYDDDNRSMKSYS